MIDTEKLYKTSGLHDIEDTIEIAIRGKDAMGAMGDTFFGRNEIFSLAPILVDVILPYGSWQLGAIPQGGW